MPDSSAHERIAAAASAAAPAIWDYELTSGAFLATDGLRRLYGLEEDAPFDFADFVAATHPDDRPLWAELFEGVYWPPPAEKVRYRIVTPDGELKWLAVSINIASGPDGPTGYTGLVTDISEERRTADALIASEERLRFAVEAGRMAVWEVDMASGRLTVSRELNLLLGLPVDAEPTLADVRKLYAPGEIERLEREAVTYERVLERTGPGRQAVRRDWVGIPSHDRTQIQAEFSIVCPDGRHKQLLLRAQHAPSIDGVGQRVTGVLVDISDRKLAEERMALVARELQHRVKNSLAIVQSIALQTFRTNADPKRAAEIFSARVRALGVATDAVLLGGGTEAPLGEVVEQIVAPYRGEGADPFVIEGQDVGLSARFATSLGMALHELCTNAVKYGSLSAPEGRVEIRWTVADGQLDLTWRESGGPIVLAPEKTGFGTRLFRTVIADGAVEIDYTPEGVKCRIVLPLA